MKERPTEQGAAVAHNPTRWSVVTATSTVQAVMAFAGMTLASVAPEVAKALDVPPSLIGYQFSLVFGSGIFTSLFAGTLIRRWGACRTTQASLLLGGTGCALTAVPHLATVGAASIVIGCAYGVTNPSASHLLSRFAAPRHRNLVFSVKQAGVPLGGILAGIIAPPMALSLGWQSVPLAVAAAVFVVMAALQFRRRAWDDDRDPRGRLRESPLAGLTMIMRRPTLRWLSFTAVCYLVAQLCLTGFLVTLLVEEIGFTLIAAGFLLSLVQAGAVAGRLSWGLLADRLGDGRAVLFWIGLSMTVLALFTTQLSQSWPLVAVQTMFIVFGLTAIGWNGVYYAEIARLSPLGQVGTVTGGSLAISYIGVLIGPSLFSLAYEGIGSYTATFGLLALLSAAGALFAALSLRSRG